MAELLYLTNTGLLTLFYFSLFCNQLERILAYHYWNHDISDSLQHSDGRWVPKRNCTEGKFGWRCLSLCNCRHKRSCDPLTGACPDGCKNNFYGKNCLLKNKCMYDSRGITYTGSVAKSKTGKPCLKWEGQRGVRPDMFPDGIYPENYCRNINMSADYAANPWCMVASSKYEDCNITSCDCPEYWFGIGCKYECHCKKDDKCDINGVCKSGCAAGWTGNNCQKRCKSGTYGHSCHSSCGKCKNNSCNPETGICEQHCIAGYTGNYCTKQCPNGQYGRNCNLRCGNCRLDNSCNKKTGYCKYGCKPGFMGPTCKTKCANPHYGHNCSYPCGYCLKGTSCHHANGICPHGCESGYMGEKCRTVCEYGFYGQNCNMTCGWCVKGKEECHVVTGKCVNGCQKGYEGTTCAKAVVPTKKMSTTGAVVAALIASIVVVLVTFLVFHRYRRNQKVKHSSFRAGPDVVPDIPEGSKETDPFLIGSPHENGRHILPTTHSSPEPSENGETDEPLYMNVNTKKMNSPVKIEDLYNYIQTNKANNNSGFKKEFKQLPEGLLAMCTTAQREENKEKNRYKDIIAYDHSRVHLDLVPGDPYSDYVNASYLDGYKREKAYVASQGPNKPMLKDFWRMVWQKNICKIVMLTDTVEASKKKCEKYWPDSGVEKYGEIVVENIDNAHFTDYIIRTFKLNRNENTRIVKHFHFITWSDHGAPMHPTSLLIFKRKVKLYNPNSLDPILVHCSAGSGRTGCFVALDYCMEQAKSEGIVDVLGCVQLMRTNRVNMIQNIDQYIFVYDALLEATMAGETTIPRSMFNETYQKWCLPNKDSFLSNIEDQFKVLYQLCQPVPRDEYRAALESENLSKNRFKNILPANRCRPYLYTMADDCNDYINAVFLPGYTRQIAYIVTQMPLPKTLADFWRLLYDHQSDTVVMLNDYDRNDKTCALYWPEEYGYTVEHGPLSIQLLSSSEIDPIVAVRVFQLRHVSKGEERAIKQFQFNAWPGMQKLPNTAASIIRLYNQVQEWLSQNGKGPITVHCMDGARRSGLFCAISAVIERMKVDREVDVFQTVKQIRVNRYQFIEDVEQYDFCYKVIQQYLNSQ
ncbi:receptor-type tyrosine-protein phosphatase T isoform X1 [Octopus bimaculoides]|nr:receptor-type tyrosine-protein phosphatase T isoform X1 [Octopus bimaculoides]